MNRWLIIHIVSLVLGVAGFLSLLIVWKSGKWLDAVVKYLGLEDPDHRISNKKVLVTAATFAGIVAAVSATAKSVATSGDVGPNVVFLWMVVIGGGLTHAGIQSKLNPTLPTNGQDTLSRSSGAQVQPSGPGAAG